MTADDKCQTYLQQWSLRAALLYKKLHFKGLQWTKWPWKSLKVIRNITFQHIISCCWCFRAAKFLSCIISDILDNYCWFFIYPLVFEGKATGSSSMFLMSANQSARPAQSMDWQTVHSAVSIQHRRTDRDRTDRQTDRQTDRFTMTAYTALCICTTHALLSKHAYRKLTLRQYKVIMLQESSNWDLLTLAPTKSSL